MQYVHVIITFRPFNIQLCINFRFWICTDHLFMIAHFCISLPSVYKNVWSGNFSQDVKLYIPKDSGTVCKEMWCGYMFFSLPSLKMNVTTLLKHLCEKPCIKLNFIFGNKTNSFCLFVIWTLLPEEEYFGYLPLNSLREMTEENDLQPRR